MADLVAQGREARYRWQRPLPVGETVVLGRGKGDWGVPWDDQISRQHAELRLRSDGVLEVRRIPTSLNPVFLRGQEASSFEVRTGEHFVIGETTFLVIDAQATATYTGRSPVEERTFSPRELREVPFRDAEDRLDVLTRLPEMISRAANDEELCTKLVDLLLAGIPRAGAAALVVAGEGESGHEAVRVLHGERRDADGPGPHPSTRLILEAMQRKQSVLHIWGTQEDPAAAEFTHGEGFDWAFCTPVRGETPEGWGIFVAGHFLGQGASRSDPVDLRDAVKFAELAAAILGSLRHARRLQRRDAMLSQFFSPVVLRALSEGDGEAALVPKMTEATVLFCDLRGFSREAERCADDLIALLDRVGHALGVMTQQIMEQGGVIADFQGDAALGFWGWPIEQPDAVLRACRAALGIRAHFRARRDGPNCAIEGFQAGIGIATGRVVAGKIGSVDQVKVGVFGPTVNLAARLEGLTKAVGAPILVDETTALRLRTQLDPSTARLRCVAVVRPYGLETPLTVHELLPPQADYPQLDDQHIAFYEQALESLTAGHWADAYHLLHKVPPDDDVKDFLLGLIAQHKRVPPPGWDGVITVGSKS